MQDQFNQDGQKKMDVIGDAKGRRVRFRGIVHNQFSVDGIWLKGNFHCHLKGWEDQAAGVYNSRGYDFISGMDHDEVMDVPGYENTIIVPGAEISPGHFLALGIKKVPDFEFDTANLCQTTVNMIKRVRDEGALAVIAHPLFTDWTWEELNMLCDAGLNGLEVYNYNFWRKGDVGIADQIWHFLMGKGRYLTALGGDDAHGPEGILEEQKKGVEWSRRGFTGVFARQRTVESILEAVRLGRTFASEGPVLHSVEFTDDGRLIVKCSPAAICHFRSRGGFGGISAFPREGKELDDQFEFDFKLKGYRVKEDICVIVEDDLGRRAWVTPVRLDLKMDYL